MNASLAQQLFTNGLIVGSFFALIGLSWNVIYATTGIFHFAHTLAFVIAAYGAVLAASNGHASPVAIVSGVVAGALAGGLMELLFYRRFRRAGSNALALFLASLGLFVAGVNVVQLVFGPTNRSIGKYPDHLFTIGDATFRAIDVAMVVFTWLLVLLIVLWERSTRWGRALSAVRTNPTMARSVGINVDRAFLIAFVGGSALVGLGAVYYTANNVANPSMGVDPIISGLIAMFLGGIGNTLGVALGGLVLGLSQSLSGLVLSSEYQTIGSFVILMIILIVRPQGLLGRAAR